MPLSKPLPVSVVPPTHCVRFWNKVDQRGASECWPWTGALQGKGYGKFVILRRRVIATRLGWLIVHGHDPHPLHVLHKCDNAACCNPSHWFLGTNHENILDRNLKGRGGRKINADVVTSIHSRMSSGESQQSIADSIGVNQTLISAIKRGTAWAHCAA